MKRGVFCIIFACLLTGILLLTSCSSSGAAAQTSSKSPAVTTAAATSSSAILTVTNGSTVRNYTFANVSGFTQTLNFGGQRNSQGVVSGNALYTGVAIVDLLKGVGGISSGQKVKMTSADGTSITLTYDQLTAGTFSTYDATGVAVTPSASDLTKPVVCLVYWENDKALDTGVGPLEVGILYGIRLITDDSNWVKNVTKIEISQ